MKKLITFLFLNCLLFVSTNTLANSTTYTWVRDVANNTYVRIDRVQTANLQNLYDRSQKKNITSHTAKALVRAGKLNAGSLIATTLVPYLAGKLNKSVDDVRCDVNLSCDSKTDPQTETPPPYQLFARWRDKCYGVVGSPQVNFTYYIANGSLANPPVTCQPFFQPICQLQNRNFLEIASTNNDQVVIRCRTYSGTSTNSTLVTLTNAPACPVGELFDSSTGLCIPEENAQYCPPGWLPVNEECVPENPIEGEWQHVSDNDVTEEIIDSGLSPEVMSNAPESVQEWAWNNGSPVSINDTTPASTENPEVGGEGSSPDEAVDEVVGTQEEIDEEEESKGTINNPDGSISTPITAQPTKPDLPLTASVQEYLDKILDWLFDEPEYPDTEEPPSEETNN